jgi:hypothetical protein
MKLEIQNLGPVNRASLTFGDLTVLVGPQASGKGIALQLLKLLVDTGAVQGELRRYGLDWNGQLPQFLDAYFGEDMRGIWKRRLDDDPVEGYGCRSQRDCEAQAEGESGGALSHPRAARARNA